MRPIQQREVVNIILNVPFQLSADIDQRLQGISGHVREKLSAIVESCSHVYHIANDKIRAKLF